MNDEEKNDEIGNIALIKEKLNKKRFSIIQQFFILMICLSIGGFIGMYAPPLIWACLCFTIAFIILKIILPLTEEKKG